MTMESLQPGFLVPEHVREYLRGEGYTLPMDPMDGWVRAWDDWMAARGGFYDYRDTDGFGRMYEVHRRSLHPAMRVCREWGSLLLNENVQVVCENQECTDWLTEWFGENGFMASAQATLVRAFGLGTGAWVLWCDTDDKGIKIRSYDARMVIPLTWDETGVTECAFCTKAFYRGKAVDQLQMHIKGILGYKIKTVCFDDAGNVVNADGILDTYETYGELPTFAIVKPAVENTRVDLSPYGQSVFADAVDALQAVDIAFDALFNEVDVSKMRIFLSDVMFDSDRDGTRGASIPFGKGDCTVFRKAMSTEDTIQEFAPALRTDAQAEALRIGLQVLGDLTGFGITYFDFDNAGYVKTATEVSSDNSALMRNIRRHENLLEQSIAAISHAVLACARRLELAQLPDEGTIRVEFDDSIVTDTAAEKEQDLRELNLTLAPWEYRMKWYGEDEQTARKRAAGLVVAGTGSEPSEVEKSA